MAFELQKTSDVTKNIETDYYGQDCVEICRKIRKCAYANHIKFDDSAQSSSNLHLFKLAESCEISVKQLILSYLSLLQPYALEQYQKNTDEHIWICDLGYQISVLIKLSSVDSDSPIIVSLQESHIYSRNRDLNEKLCAVLIDTAHEICCGYSIDFVEQNGLIRGTIHAFTDYYEGGVALIRYSYVTSYWKDVLNNRLTKLTELYYTEQKSVNVLDMTIVGDVYNMSFISYGYATVNNICMLLDLYTMFADDGQSKAYISDIAVNILLEVPNKKYEEIADALRVKHDISRNKLLDALLSLENCKHWEIEV